MNKRIDPETRFRKKLLEVQQPARYIGGEFQLKPLEVSDDDFLIGLCFPDLYEIGMSNTAMKILYDMLNSIDGIRCERVFTPAPDFEAVLTEEAVPLYTLETGIPLHELDMLCFTVGYELSATNILTVLDLGNIPILSEERKEHDPIILAGGPAMTNPLPFSRFFDGVYIGEAEDLFSQIIREVSSMHRSGTERAFLIEKIHSFGPIWHPGKKVSKRAIAGNFSETAQAEKKGLYSYYTVPTLRPVQDNGVVEIMRGCPNGCRFCHAGEFYKPYRQRDCEQVSAAAEQLVGELGYRDITLSSLSSGDHQNILPITKAMTARFRDRHVSFSLPSLKVDTFSLPILQELSSIRKSGLTFAVETPTELWQKSMNKRVPVEQVIEIILQAKQLGWRQAKFYFMTGLPFVDRSEEIEEIVSYITQIASATKIQLSINIGTFIPKPHTSFQWAPLMKPEEALEHLLKLKHTLRKRNRNLKVSFHDPMISFIEGLLSRGDERVGDIILSAYRKGARLDAWDEYVQKDIWREVYESQDWDVTEEICRAHGLDEDLPWESITLASGPGYLKKEYLKAQNHEMTDICRVECSHNCGVCSPKHSLLPVPDTTDLEPTVVHKRDQEESVPQKLLFTYRKFGKGIYISHINMMHMIEKSFQRSGLSLQFTQGYNPKPKMDFAQPLPLGISGEQEYFVATLLLPESEVSLEYLKVKLNEKLPEGFEINSVDPVTVQGKKSLTASYASSLFGIDELDAEGMKLMETISEAENISLESRAEDYVELRIEEPKGQGSGLSGNILKNISVHMDKYKFLGKYKVIRKGLYTDNVVLLHNVFIN